MGRCFIQISNSFCGGELDGIFVDIYFDCNLGGFLK